MKAGTVARLLFALSAAFLFAGCPDVDLSQWFGNGSSDNTAATAAGPVTGFGGIKAAGAEFTDNVSTTVVDDRGRGIGGIVAGMTVTVRGTLDSDFESGTASSVTIEREVRGPVDDNGVSLDNAAIRVLGQTVLVAPATVMVDMSGDDMDLRDLKGFLDNGYRPGLEVHGGAEDNGTLHASYIGWVQDNVVDDDDVALRGTVQSLVVSTRTFRIGAQQVNYSNLPSDGDIDWPATGLVNGQVVDVRGYLDAVGGSGVLRTDRAGDRIQVMKTDYGDASDRVALEGYAISGDSSSFGLSVPGGVVTVNGNVAPSGDAFGPGKKVRVNGRLAGTGGKTLQASSVFVLKAADVLLEGVAEELPADGDTIEVLGKTVETDRYTLFRDPAGGVRDGFGLSTLAAGDIVRVTGWLEGTAGSGKVTAVRVDRIAGTPGRVGLQGPVSSFVRPTSLSIIGLTVNTGSAAVDYFNRDGAEFAGRDAFYDALEALGAGAVVRVRNGVWVSAHSRIDPPSGGDRMEIEIVAINR